MNSNDNLGEQLVDLAQTPTNDSDAPIKAFITNLGKYNEGELVGQWHPFPTTPEAIAETFQKIGIDGVRYEEFFITDYDTDISGLYEHLPEYASLDELNYLANQLEALDAYDLTNLEAVLEMGDISSLKEIINLTEGNNLSECYYYIEGIEDDEDLGYHYIEDAGIYDTAAMGSLARYIDYESFGRDVRLDEGGTFTNGGYIYATGDSIDEYYDGINVSDEYRVFPRPDGDEPELSGMMTVLLVKPGEAPLSVEMDSDLKAMQEAVGGCIEAVYPYEDRVALVCNDEGKLIGMELNRAVRHADGNTMDIIAGPFLVCGLSADNFCSLSPELMEKYQKEFEYPEKFVQLGRQIIAVPYKTKEQEAQAMTKKSDILEL